MTGGTDNAAEKDGLTKLEVGTLTDWIVLVGKESVHLDKMTQNSAYH